MNDFVLDTNICIYCLKGKHEIRRKIEQVGTDHLKITIISLAELKYGAYYSQKVNENLKNIDNFLKQVRILFFNNEAAGLFGKIKADLRRSGQIIEDFDILIASIVMGYDDILVTGNVDHFSKINGLKYEN